MVNIIIVRLNNSKLSSFKPGYRSKWQIYSNFEKTYFMTEVPSSNLKQVLYGHITKSNIS